jgi:alpha,alpha-trehalase
MRRKTSIAAPRRLSLCVLTAFVAGAGFADLPSAERLAPVQRYIKESWTTLTRSNRDLPVAARDPKMARPAGEPWPVYVAATEDRERILADLRRVLTPEQLASVALRTLPGRPLASDEHGLLYLPHPYVVPGGRFNEMYGWDSYFIQVGLLRDNELARAKDMVENFLYEITHYGTILNANRTYFLTRSQPPFLTRMILGVFERTRDRRWLRGTRPAVERYYRYWTSEPHLIPGLGLSRYFDLGEGPAPEVVSDERDAAGRTHYDRVREYYRTHDVADYDERLYYDAAADRLTPLFYKGDRSMRESGFDPSNRFGPFSVDIIHYAPVCLNSLLYQMERDAAAIAGELGDAAAAETWRARAETRRAAVDRLLWDEASGLYLDYRFKTARRRGYEFATTFYPLWTGMASRAQADRVRNALPRFEAPGGLLTSTQATGNQWDAPFGWAPLQLIAAQGLRRYGYGEDADRLATKFIALVTKEFDEHGTILEKYDVRRRESDVSAGIRFGYSSNEIGFGWTNAVFVELLAELRHPAPRPRARVERAEVAKRDSTQSPLSTQRRSTTGTTGITGRRAWRASRAGSTGWRHLARQRLLAPVILLLALPTDVVAQARGPDQSRGATPAAVMAKARAELEAGLAFEQRNQLQEAAQAYERALALAPAMAQAHDRLGFVLGRQGNTAGALEHFARAVELDAGLFDAQYHLGATSWWTKDYARAESALEAAVRLRPAHAEARYYLGVTLRQTGRLQQAVEQLRRAVRANPRVAVAHLQLGLALQQFGDLDGAIDHLRQAAAADPSAVDARNSLGLALMQRGEAQAAEETFRALVADHPESSTARLNLGAALMHRGDLAAAVRVYRELLERDPASAEASYNLGVALKNQDDFSAAETALRRAIDLDPTLADALFTLGVVTWQTGRAEEGAKYFREAIARRPAYGEAHYMLGTVLRQLGRTAEALAELRESIKHRPDAAEAHLSIGQVLLQQGARDGAAAAFAEADRLNRKKADGQASTFAVSIGVERLKSGDVTGAVAQFREAVRLAPDNAQAHYQLALALRRLGRTTEARRHFEQARRLAPYLQPPPSDP